MPRSIMQPDARDTADLIRRQSCCVGGTRVRTAFTTIELIIVVLILGILAAVAVPAYAQSVLRYRADFAARRLESDLRYASTLARTTSTEVNIQFVDSGQPDGSYYWFEAIEDPQRPGSLLTVRFNDEPYRVELSQAPSEIWFDVYGAPLNSETWVINSGTAHERTVSIDKNSGEITIQ